MRRWIIWIVAVAPAAMWAQSIISARAGLIHYFEGDVSINGEEIVPNGDQFQVLKEAETLATGRGRAEILLNAGTYLRVAEGTSFVLDSGDLEDTRLTLLTGTATIEVAELPKQTAVVLRVLHSEIEVRKRGLYEFTADFPGSVRVYDGELALATGKASPLKLTKGRQAALDELAAGPVKFDTADTTPLYRWTARRARYIAQANEVAARSVVTSSWSAWSGPGLTPLGFYRGIWAWNPYFGMFTYMPLTGWGYSPFGIRIFSPVTYFNSYIAPPVFNAGGGGGWDMGRAAAPSSGYSSISSGGGAPAAPAASAPAVSTPNTGGGGEAGRRR